MSTVNFSNFETKFSPISTDYVVGYSFRDTVSQTDPFEVKVPIGRLLNTPNGTISFVPSNIATRSNERIELIDYNTRAPSSSATFAPWWSGIQTVNLPSVPVNTTAALVEIYFNVNAYANNGQYLSIRRDITETAGAPSNSPLSAIINMTEFAAITASKNLRLSLDPTGSPQYSLSTLSTQLTSGVIPRTVFEAESVLTLPIYFETTTNSFQWFITDRRAQAVPISPEYHVSMNLIGYYVTSLL